MPLAASLGVDAQSSSVVQVTFGENRVWRTAKLGCTPRGSCNRTLLRRVLGLTPEYCGKRPPEQ